MFIEGHLIARHCIRLYRYLEASMQGCNYHRTSITICGVGGGKEY